MLRHRPPSFLRGSRDCFVDLRTPALLRRSTHSGSASSIYALRLRFVVYRLLLEKNLLERLVKVVEEDNEKFLLKLKQRIDRVDIDLPTIEVRFEHLNVDADAYVGSR
nr:pleiotropic drug resistance protein 1-like [Ipomoea trifida]